LEILRSGRLGQIVFVRAIWDTWYDPEPDDPKYWIVIKEKSGGGPLVGLGCHMLDLLIGMFDLPLSVRGLCETLTRQWDVEDTASAIGKLRNGAHLEVGFTWSSETKKQELEICGTRGRLLWSRADNGPVVLTLSQKRIERLMPNAENAHLPLVEDFVEAVLEGRPPVCSLQEAAKTNLLIDAIYASSAEHREVKLQQ
jgi:predicted dehydrogenase